MQAPKNRANTSSFSCNMADLEKVQVAEGNVDPSLKPDLGNVYEVDAKLQERVVRKLDLFITPVLFIVYLSCFIDRANIGT